MGDPWNEIFEIPEMQWWDKPTDRAQTVDEKNVVKMFLKMVIIMFSSRL